MPLVSQGQGAVPASDATWRLDLDGDGSTEVDVVLLGAGGMPNWPLLVLLTLALGCAASASGALLALLRLGGWTPRGRARRSLRFELIKVLLEEEEEEGRAGRGVMVIPVARGGKEGADSSSPRMVLWACQANKGKMV